MRRRREAILHQVNGVQLLIGAVGLFAGLLVYLGLRSPGSVYFVAVTGLDHLTFYKGPPGGFAAAAGILPAFIHVFAFSLLTAGLLACGKLGCFVVALTWSSINAAFEVAQGLGDHLIGILPGWFLSVPVLENSETFFAKGTFDAMDIVAALGGGGAAYWVLSATMRRRQTS